MQQQRYLLPAKATLQRELTTHRLTCSSLLTLKFRLSKEKLLSPTFIHVNSLLNVTKTCNDIVHQNKKRRPRCSYAVPIPQCRGCCGTELPDRRQPPAQTSPPVQGQREGKAGTEHIYGMDFAPSPPESHPGWAAMLCPQLALLTVVALST